MSDTDADRKAGQDHQPDASKDQAAETPKDKPRSKLPLIIAAVVFVVALLVWLLYWLATRDQISTDDAYTDGRAVSIAANVSGYVTALAVDDNSFVRTGDPLVTIDPREDAAALSQAQANLTLAQAQLASAVVDLQTTRVRAPAQLVQAQAQLTQALAQQAQTRRNYFRETTADQRATTPSDIDQATQQLRTADAAVASARAQVASAALVPQQIESAQDAVQERQAQRAQAQANLLQAQVKFSYNVITAPQDGFITMRNVERGSYVQAGQQIFYIVTPQVWVSANFKETQLTRIRPGQRVDMTVDAYPGLHLRGHIDSIQWGSGARFSEFPAQNATGNYVKIVRRVPVKIIIDSGLPPALPGLPLGISVEPTVYVK